MKAAIKNRPDSGFALTMEGALRELQSHLEPFTYENLDVPLYEDEAGGDRNFSTCGLGKISAIETAAFASYSLAQGIASEESPEDERVGALAQEVAGACLGALGVLRLFRECYDPITAHWDDMNALYELVKAQADRARALWEEIRVR